MCVFDRRNPLSLTYLFISTKRLPFSPRTAGEPLHLPIPSNFADISGSRLQPLPRQSAYGHSRGEEPVDRHGAGPEGYETARFKPAMAVYG